MPTFRTTIISGGGNTAGIVIPPEIVEELGKGKKPPVKVTLNGKTYRNTVAVMGGQFMVGVSAENRALTGVKVGDELDVTLELDTEPRTVDVPEDLAAALAAKPGATEAFEASAPSKKKEFVRQVNEAKSQETRDRRIANIVDKLP
ncbi:MAG: YdeI/OmpD-associated family protein [Chloroflexi bacterium]|nr:YdeI/OmpD-associated family protein [Chloroflexota bacterium]MCC6894882.1 DUF1905 domain-containing protein [Anaerolineae bacterium]